MALARDAAAGRPWLATIEGPAGSGKSALLRACVAGLDDGCTVVRAYGDELAVDAPMGLMAQIIGDPTGPPFTAALQLIDHLADLQQDGRVAVLAIEDLH